MESEVNEIETKNQRNEPWIFLKQVKNKHFQV